MQPLPKALTIPKSTVPVREDCQAKEAILQQALEELHLSDKEVRDAVAFQRFQTEHYEDGVKVITGGRIKLANQLLSDVERMRAELNQMEHLAPKPGEKDYDINLDRWMRNKNSLRKDLQYAIHQFKEYSRDIETGAIKWAAVDAQKDMVVAQANRPSVGFKPLAVQINVSDKKVDVAEPKRLQDGETEESA